MWLKILAIILLLALIGFVFLNYFGKLEKKIGQKNSYFYNLIYIALIDLYYKNQNKKLIKEEIKDFYEEIIIKPLSCEAFEKKLEFLRSILNEKSNLKQIINQLQFNCSTLEELRKYKVVVLSIIIGLALIVGWLLIAY